MRGSGCFLVTVTLATAIIKRLLVHFRAQRSYIDQHSGYYFTKLSHHENNSNFMKKHKSAHNMGFFYYGALQVPIMGYCRFIPWRTAGSYVGYCRFLCGILQVPIKEYCRFLTWGTAGSYHGYCRFLSWGTAGSY